MKLIALLVAVLIVGLLASRQLKTTVAVPGAQAPSANGASPAQSVPIEQAPKAAGDAVNQALQQGAAQTEQRLKDAEAK